MKHIDCVILHVYKKTYVDHMSIGTIEYPWRGIKLISVSEVTLMLAIIITFL